MMNSKEKPRQSLIPTISVLALAISLLGVYLQYYHVSDELKGVLMDVSLESDTVEVKLALINTGNRMELVTAMDLIRFPPGTIQQHDTTKRNWSWASLGVRQLKKGIPIVINPNDLLVLTVREQLNPFSLLYRDAIECQDSLLPVSFSRDSSDTTLVRQVPVGLSFSVINSRSDLIGGQSGKLFDIFGSNLKWRAVYISQHSLQLL